jgi:Xaa-Pro aminopeptidase
MPIIPQGYAGDFRLSAQVILLIMYKLGAIFLVGLCALPAFGAEPRIPLDEYKSRREALRKANADAVTILFGASERDGGEIRSGFFQEPNFYYLTGWIEPGAILVLTPSTETLLLPRRNKDQERWTGPKYGPTDSGISAITGFENIVAAETFESHLPQWIESGKRIYTLFGDSQAEALKKALPLRDMADAKLPIARLRMVKSAAEIAMIQRSTDATLEAHRAAWKMIKPGVTEYQVAAKMVETYTGEGCERNSYAPIVGSGPNAAILHYSKNRRTLDNGELVLMDVAGECAMYATDITRTVPANGKFTARQRELYDVVLGAQKAVIAAIRPGMSVGRLGPNSLNQIAKDYINTHGKDKHGNPLGQYFTHGISHHVGLDVHDAMDPAQPLTANMVITVEPGIYIPEEGIGIRIEDMVLVTEEGAKVLSAALPREADDIERAFARTH